MTTHSVHPGSHEYGLADDCPRCDEHAHDPMRGLDAPNLAELVRRVADDITPRSENEAIAMRNVKQVMDQACELASTNVVDFVKYARYYGLQFTFTIPA